MTVTLDDFRNAWVDKPNRDAALSVAQQYVAENAAVLEQTLADKNSDELVQMIDLARAAGNENLVTTITIWELAKFERRNVGGIINQVLPPLPKLRGGGA